MMPGMAGLGDRVRARWQQLSERGDPADAPRGSLPERGSDRYLGGVASGIAHALDVDPFVVRVGLVLTAVYFPAVIVFYTVAWLLLRDERTHSSLVAGLGDPDGWRPVAGVIALGIGATVLAPELGPGGDDGVKFGVLLFALGLLLVTGRARRDSPDEEPPREEDAEAGGDDQPVAAGPPPPGGPPLVSWSRLRPQRPRQPPAYLGWFGISALVVLVGILAAVDQAWEPVKPGVAVSLGLLLIGIVLLVATWRGRARLLLPAGVLLLPLWAGFAVTDVPRNSPDGDRTYRIDADDPFPVELNHGYGDMEVDLSGIELGDGERRRLRLGLTAGRAVVNVPREVHLHVVGDVGLGDVNINDRWRVRDSGPMFPGGVDLQVGDPLDGCEQIVHYPELPVLWPGDPGYPDGLASYPDEPIYPEDERYPAPAGGTTTTSIEFVDPWQGTSCTPAEPLENPAELELVLNVGIGSVEVNRV